MRKPSASSAERLPCSICGSRLRFFEKHLAATLTFRGGLRGVAYRVSKTKWFAKLLDEPSFHTTLRFMVA